MRWFIVLTLPLLLTVFLVPASNGREWTDSTGHYHVEADLIGFNDNMVAIKKKNNDLVAVAIDKLSKEDQQFLKSEEAAASAREQSNAQQTWTMRGGLKIIGKAIDYGRRDVTVQRIRGKTYVNDKPFDSYDGIRREMIPRIVSYYEKTEIDDKKGLDQWLIKQRGAARTFTCEGVVLELENGELYGVPFFFFSDKDLKVLEPGWKTWLAADKSREEQEKQQFMLEHQAQAYQQSQQEQRQMMQLQIQLQAYQAGLFDLWEVALLPGSGGGVPQLVVVPARNSDQAAAAALQQYPGYFVGSAAKVIRK